ncbi:DUF4145 domain-containing protein [Marinobacter sp. F3R08]|uniref:DUF4145 domain-containing protein n=1 Tax=Marinobacter sp. F3R08 TaxID=2841559 RepID=UPI001C07F04C|nr:DUF4145 domain-containing protein [Marinobacter sp. F3R08]MBU2953106.1 DUF4145 domain-containing protein [Marinobacter sp. F3R08]
MIKTEILSVRNPQWANENRTAINCLVRTNTLHQEVPFTASPLDLEAHGRETFAKCLAGEFGEIAPMGPKLSEQSPSQPEPPAEYLRLERFLLEANRENSRKSFRSVVIVWGSLLDNLLDEMLEGEALRTSAAAEARGKPPRNFDARINRALGAGLIDQEDADRCHHIRRIRNAAAHEWELSLETKNILPSLRALHEADYSELLVFREDLEFLLQQVYSASCGMLVMKFVDRLSAVSR